MLRFVLDYSQDRSSGGKDMRWIFVAPVTDRWSPRTLFIYRIIIHPSCRTLRVRTAEGMPSVLKWVWQFITHCNKFQANQTFRIYLRTNQTARLWRKCDYSKNHAMPIYAYSFTLQEDVRTTQSDSTRDSAARLFPVVAQVTTTSLTTINESDTRKAWQVRILLSISASSQI